MAEICGDTAGVRPSGFPCFLLAGDLEGNVLIGCPLLLRHFLKSVSTVGIAEKVSDPLWAFP